ncbi:MAG: glycosyltransferase family 1 protein [Dehalococcoidia bacterium]|nr:MAG: glycosyltransferase family 1 protein [Dehalococcoidia bacterium]
MGNIDQIKINAWSNEMKVLFLMFRDIKNPSSVGGDYYLWELAKGLHYLGNDVTVLCHKFKGSRNRENIDGIQVIRLGGLLALPLKMLQTYFKEFKGKYDIIIEEAIGGQRFPYFASIYIKEPLIAVWHQKHEKIFYEQYPYPIALFLVLIEKTLAIIYRKRIIVTPSKGAKQILLTLGFSSKNIKVVNDGVGKPFQKPNSDRVRRNIIVCLGKLRRYKRFDQAISTFKVVRKYLNNDYKLVIAGKISEIDSNYLAFLKQFAKKLGVENWVELRTNISEDEKVELLEYSKALLQPAPIEGFSIVVAEANRCGTPVVVSDGVPEDVVIDGYNGFVYHFGDIDASAEQLAKVLNNKDLWKKMSLNAINWSKQFTWKKSSLVLHNYLKKLCNQQSK